MKKVELEKQASSEIAQSRAKDYDIAMKRTIGMAMLGAFIALGAYGLIRIMGMRDFLLWEVCGGGGVMIYICLAIWLIRGKE
jgi:hypothetical protein